MTYRTAEDAVASTRGFSGPSGIHRYVLAENIKREPREGYALQRKGQEHLFATKEQAKAELAMWEDKKDFEVIKAREVIDEKD